MALLRKCEMGKKKKKKMSGFLVQYTLLGYLSLCLFWSYF